MLTESHVRTKEILTRAALNRPAEPPAVAQQRLSDCARLPAEEVLGKMNTRMEGLSDKEVEISRKQYGDNVVTSGHRISATHLLSAFVNPYPDLIALAVISHNRYHLRTPKRSLVTVVIISAMVFMSGASFVQELRSGNARGAANMIISTAAIIRLEDSEGTGHGEAMVGD